MFFFIFVRGVALIIVIVAIGGSFPARKKLNWGDSLLFSSSPSNHSTVMRRTPDRQHPFPKTNPLTLPQLFLWTHSSTQPSFWNRHALQVLQKPHTLKNRSGLASKPRQVSWKVQTNSSLMSWLDCLWSCNASVSAHLVIGYWKVNIVLQRDWVDM